MYRMGFLIVTFLISLLSFTSFSGAFVTSNVAAAESDSAAAQEITPTPIPQSNYELPYPGLLPDSPLYIFKVTRDKIVNFLISDPLKKAEFNLLQADKRLNAGVYLFDKNKIPLAITTISKAENYFHQALASAREARREGLNASDITGKLRASSEKHKEILIILEKKSPKNFKTGFSSQQKRIIELQAEINLLTPKT